VVLADAECFHIVDERQESQIQLEIRTLEKPGVPLSTLLRASEKQSSRFDLIESQQ